MITSTDALDQCAIIKSLCHSFLLNSTSIFLINPPETSRTNHWQSFERVARTWPQENDSEKPPISNMIICISYVFHNALTDANFNQAYNIELKGKIKKKK